MISGWKWDLPIFELSKIYGNLPLGYVLVCSIEFFPQTIIVPDLKKSCQMLDFPPFSSNAGKHYSTYTIWRIKFICTKESILSNSTFYSMQKSNVLQLQLQVLY